MVINVVGVGVVVVVVPSVVCALGRDDNLRGVMNMDTLGVVRGRRGSTTSAAGEARTTEGEE